MNNAFTWVTVSIVNQGWIQIPLLTFICTTQWGGRCFTMGVIES